MQHLRHNAPESAYGALQHGLPRVLHSAGTERTPIKETGGNDAGSDSTSGKDWAGRCFGIREPGPKETPLSMAEVEVALKEVLTWRR